MEELSLRWHGPFSFVTCPDARIIYDASEAKRPGVYLWTVPFEEGSYINYVGIAKWSIAARNDEHMRSFLSGKYTYYKAAPFAQLEKIVAFDAASGLSTFLTQYTDTVRELFNSLRSIRIYFAPLERDQPTLELIESGIILELRRGSDPVKSFLDNGRISRKLGEPTILLRFSDGPRFIGLPNELQV